MLSPVLGLYMQFDSGLSHNPSRYILLELLLIKRKALVKSSNLANHITTEWHRGVDPRSI